VLTLLGRSRQAFNVDSTVISAEGLMARLSTLGVTDPTDCQLQVLHETNSYRLRLLLSPGAPSEATTRAVVEALVADTDFREVITGDHCLGVTVERVEPALFARTERGKVPILHQAGAE
jgi:phenylacetate-CoA ligase